jgi:chromate transport protein ChrA
MRFSLLKAIKSTHRHPINRVLHVLGLTIYAVIIGVVFGFLDNVERNPIDILALFMLAVALFLLGHKIEGNLKAMTWVILFKYLKAVMTKEKKKRS